MFNMPNWLTLTRQPALDDKTRRLVYVSDSNRPPSGFRCGIHISFSLDQGARIEQNGRDEPSTIYLNLPIVKPDDSSSVPPPSYYPSYTGLSTEQRWIYLDWLTNNRTTPINIGYVFVFYYGLERQLLTGEFELAFDEILSLRNIYKNNSFLQYSKTALIGASIIRNRYDKLERCMEHLMADDSDMTLNLLLAYKMKKPLDAKLILQSVMKLPGINRRYINMDPSLFEHLLNENLYSRYGQYSLPTFPSYDMMQVVRRQLIWFANTSFSMRSSEIPDFLKHAPFINEITDLIKDTNEAYKAALRTGRFIKIHKTGDK